MQLIKVAWYVFRVKNRHPGSPSDPSWTTMYHRSKAGVCILDFKTTLSEFQKASQTATKRGKAKLCILDFKTT